VVKRLPGDYGSCPEDGAEGQEGELEWLSVKLEVRKNNDKIDE